MMKRVNCTFFENGLLQRKLCRSSSAHCCGPLSAKFCSSSACDYMDNTPGITPTVFWSILGVLSGIGALIIGITYLICRFKKPTNQVADRDRNMMDDNFVHTNVRTVLYPDHHLERQYLQPAPVVRLESSRPLSYGAAEQRSCHTATEATPVAIGASTSTPIPLTITSSTAFNNRPRLNKLAIGRWSALKKKPGCENDLPGGFFDKNSVRKEQFKLNFVSAGKTHTAVKLAPKSNFLTMKPKCTVITL